MHLYTPALANGLAYGIELHLLCGQSRIARTNEKERC